MADSSDQKNVDAAPPKVLNKFEVPRSCTPVATQFVIQYASGGEFFITFFEEAAHAFTVNDRQEWKFEDYTPICVARVSMSISRIPGLIKSLQTCLDKFKPKPPGEPADSPSEKGSEQK